MKQVFLIFCLLCGLTACDQSDKQLLIGRWEMPVTDELGLTYPHIIELNMAEPTFTSEYDSEGKKYYGYMDFSNINRIYHYDIDSVAALGNNLYVVRTIDENDMWSDGISIDTLRYLPETRQLTYLNWTFDYVSDIKPFVGEWEDVFPEGYTTVHLSLYQKIKAPDEYPFNGAECYGWIIYSTDVGCANRIITEVEHIDYTRATIRTIFPDFPEDEPQTGYLYFFPSDGKLLYNESLLNPVEK